MKAIKLGKEILDPSTVANAWVEGDQINVILKGIKATAYMDMGSETNAQRGLDELFKAMNGEVFQNVSFESTKRAEPVVGERKSKLGLISAAFFFGLGVVAYYIIKAL